MVIKFSLHIFKQSFKKLLALNTISLASAFSSAMDLSFNISTKQQTQTSHSLCLGEGGISWSTMAKCYNVVVSIGYIGNCIQYYLFCTFIKIGYEGKTTAAWY